jgi:hypothetical protein
MPFGLDIPQKIQNIPNVSENLTDVLPSIPGIPKGIICSPSDIVEIQKYSKLIPTQIDELNYRMNLPNNCRIVKIEELMKFMKEYPNFTVPTKDSISSDLSNIHSCSDAKMYLQTKSNQLAKMLNIITESKQCKQGSGIDYQTQSIKNKIPEIDSQSSTYTEKTKYQTEMYNSVKYVNEILLIFYALLFSVIHILFLVQYLQGVNRDVTKDTIWLTVFFLYPYLIYYVEKTIYSSITYLLSLIYGATYVYQFDKLLLFTDFYYDPSAKSPKAISSL